MLLTAGKKQIAEFWSGSFPASCGLLAAPPQQLMCERTATTWERVQEITSSFTNEDILKTTEKKKEGTFLI